MNEFYYVVIDIGCIECGETSHCLGVFEDKKIAQKIIKDHEKRQEENWVGEHRFMISKIKLNKEYKVQYKE